VELARQWVGAGATVCLYDSSPFHPDLGVLLQYAEENVDHFGVSQDFYRPGKIHSARTPAQGFKSILSTVRLPQRFPRPTTALQGSFVVDHRNRHHKMLRAGQSDVARLFGKYNRRDWARRSSLRRQRFRMPRQRRLVARGVSVDADRIFTI
jgi:hypothetical protein